MTRALSVWFPAVKYLTYALLSFNVYLFLQEEMLSLEHTYAGGIEPGDIIQVFAATIDTTAWVILLLLFELETSVLPDEAIVGWVKRALHGIRAFCYLFIVYALYGYVIELFTLYNVEPMVLADVCSLVQSYLSG